MEKLSNNPSFEAKVLETATASIDAKSNEYFDQYQILKKRETKQTELDFEYRDYNNASSSKRIGRMFLLVILFPLVAFFDYSSIASFISYLSVSAGSWLGGIIGFFGWLFFALLELATGWVILYYAKDKPFIKFVAVLVAIGLIITPSYLIYTTYDITAIKTSQLFHKTVALIIVSILIHLIFYLVIADLWAGIFVIVYMIKSWFISTTAPLQKMKGLKKSLQDDYTVFARGTATMPLDQQARLLTNLSWYIRSKITNSKDPYNLDDFTPTTHYAPATPNKGGTGKTN